MNIQLHKHCIKQLKKISAKDRDRVQERFKLFLNEPFHPQLRNHPLKGRHTGYRSIDIRPDLRAVYKEDTETDTAILVAIGSHSQLYK